jgi:hypothetical protein
MIPATYLIIGFIVSGYEVTRSCDRRELRGFPLEMVILTGLFLTFTWPILFPAWVYRFKKGRLE